MKPIRLFLLLMFIATANAFAQAPQRFNYQAVARDGSGNPIADKTIAVRTSIVDGSPGGTVLFSETFNATTSKQGLFSIQIGAGTPVSGAFSSVTWGVAARFLKVEVDPAGGSSFTLLGSSQLLSVPYALAADRLVTPLSLKDLNDVSDTTPNVDQILKWDGTSWVPANGGGSITTSSVLSGNGTSATPLTIAQQSATNGQVLQWNGTQWKPATVGGGVGDNWGTQNVVTNSTLSGGGTSASPLTIAQNGATPGLVLKWNGTAWAPAADAGDNWGTAKVNSSSQFDGDGTPVNPLKLAQQGAATGQFLKWSGTGWIPGDGGGSLTLPASGNVTDPGVGLQVQNNTGSGIVGINNNATAPNVYGVQGKVLTSSGIGTAGVFGQNNSTGSNGYGVYGVHNGSGVGVYGEVAGSGAAISAKGYGTSSIGVFGNSIGTAGSGVVGVANTGVSGTTNTATGQGVYGNATAGGYAGWFDERVVIKSNSSATKPILAIAETESSDRARVQFNNSIVGKYWEINALNTTLSQNDRFNITHFGAGDVFTVMGSGLVGIGQVNPTERLEVNGSVKVTGSIVAGGSSGLPGQELQSTGSGMQWVSNTKGVYDNMLLADQGATTPVISNSEYAPDQLNNLSFATTSGSRVSFTFSHAQLVSNNTGDVSLEVELGFKDISTGATINRVVCNDVILNNKTKSFSYTHHCQFNAAGSFKPYVVLRAKTAAGFTATGGNSNGQVTIIVVQK